MGVVAAQEDVFTDVGSLGLEVPEQRLLAGQGCLSTLCSVLQVLFLNTVKRPNANFLV